MRALACVSCLSLALVIETERNKEEVQRRGGGYSRKEKSFLSTERKEGDETFCCLSSVRERGREKSGVVRKEGRERKGQDDRPRLVVLYGPVDGASLEPGLPHRPRARYKHLLFFSFSILCDVYLVYLDKCERE